MLRTAGSEGASTPRGAVDGEGLVAGERVRGKNLHNSYNNNNNNYNSAKKNGNTSHQHGRDVQLDAVAYADVIAREYLLFRGATGALKLFDAERADEDSKTKLFKVDRVMELLFQTYIPNYQAKDMLETLEFLTQRFFCRLEGLYQDTVQRLTDDTKKCYMVNAAHNRRMDKVLEFFELHSDELIEGPNSSRWQVWLSLPYVRKPQTHPSFAGYFSREWHDLLVLSWRNFLGDIFSAMPLPVILRFNTERQRRKALEKENAQLKAELNRLHRIANASANAPGPSISPLTHPGHRPIVTRFSVGSEEQPHQAHGVVGGGGASTSAGLEWPDDAVPTHATSRSRPFSLFNLK